MTKGLTSRREGAPNVDISFEDDGNAALQELRRAENWKVERVQERSEDLQHLLRVRKDGKRHD